MENTIKQKYLSASSLPSLGIFFCNVTIMHFFPESSRGLAKQNELVLFRYFSLFYPNSFPATWCILFSGKAISRFSATVPLCEVWNGIPTKQPSAKTQAWFLGQTANSSGEKDSRTAEKEGKEVSVALTIVILFKMEWRELSIVQGKEQAEQQLVNLELLKRGNELAYQNLEDRGHHITVQADIFCVSKSWWCL